MPGNSAREEQHERPDGMSELRAAVVGGGLSGLCMAWGQSYLSSAGPGGDA